MHLAPALRLLLAAWLGSASGLIGPAQLGQAQSSETAPTEAPPACPDGRPPMRVPPAVQAVVAALDASAGQRLECASAAPALETGLPEQQIDDAIERLTAMLQALAPSVSEAGDGAGDRTVRISRVAHAPPGGTLAVEAETSAGAWCAIDVRLPSGSPSHAPGLAAQQADAQGHVAWSWQLGVSTHPGTGEITVACNGASSRVPLEVD